MQVETLVPDIAPLRAPAPSAAPNSFAQLVDAAGAILADAQRAEDAFAAHRGGLQEMVVERARADVALQIAASGAQRAAQALTTVLGMQL
jgi:flagellar hook-basal body complex protein FliE